MLKGYTYDDVLILPEEGTTETRSKVSTTSHITNNWLIEVPVIAANMETVVTPATINLLQAYGANGVMHRFCSNDKRIINARAIHKTKQSFYFAPRMNAVGLNDTRAFLKKLGEFTDIFVLDVANADNQNIKEYVKCVLLDVASDLDKHVIIGNIATASAAKDYCKMKVHGLKVGIGPGSACTTRLVTGVGVPQLTAIMDVYGVSSKYNIPIIADGGIKNYGDVGKAFVAGAHSVMIGKEFAMCMDNNASSIKGRPYMKKYHGSASFEAGKHNYIEGEGARIIIKTEDMITLKEKVQKYREALQSTISYVGENDATSIIGKQNFIQVTTNTLVENNPRLV